MSVNSNIIAASGGTCSSADCTGPNKDFDCRFTDPGYQACVVRLLLPSRSLFTLDMINQTSYKARLMPRVISGLKLTRTAAVPDQDASPCTQSDSLYYLLVTASARSPHVLQRLSRKIRLDSRAAVLIALVALQDNVRKDLITTTAASSVIGRYSD